MEAPGPVARVARLVVPVACPGCGLLDVRWCESCEAPWWEEPLRCETGAPRLDRLDPPLPVWSVAELDGPVHGLIAAWKDAGRRDLGALLGPALARAARAAAPALGEALGGAVGASSPVAVVPCPARAAHTRRRGADLPLLLARAAAAGLAAGGVPASAVAALVPARGASRGAGDRGRWRAGPARLRPGTRSAAGPRPAVLVDDVVTTGATLARAAGALEGSPMVPVGALVLASAPAPGEVLRVRPASASGALG
ncbi:ComF family protein [Demequina maris]|uniref:ComF family protein n=1 Tax=Demequina maris TaxID=1638982 RepID=UPI000781CD00|nr:hypothetical protein [Demequina maris]